MDFKLHTLFLSLFSVAAASVPPPVERIISGVSIDIEQAPWQIALLVNSTHNCGGSILSERIILTAAHCLKGWLPVNLTVRAGSRYAERGGQLLQVEDFKVHEFFNQPPTYDIGIVLLAAPLKFGPQVQPVKLAQENPKNGESVFVSGWGLLHDWHVSQVYPEDLQGVYVFILDRQTCHSLNYPSEITEDMICARGSDNGPCSGDSGGPLVRNGVQVGIVSSVKMCGVSTKPVVYASVAYFYNWIQDTIKNFENHN